MPLPEQGRLSQGAEQTSFPAPGLAAAPRISSVSEGASKLSCKLLQGPPQRKPQEAVWAGAPEGGRSHQHPGAGQGPPEVPGGLPKPGPWPEDGCSGRSHACRPGVCGRASLTPEPLGERVKGSERKSPQGRATWAVGARAEFRGAVAASWRRDVEPWREASKKQKNSPDSSSGNNEVSVCWQLECWVPGRLEVGVSALKAPAH